MVGMHAHWPQGRLCAHNHELGFLRAVTSSSHQRELSTSQLQYQWPLPLLLTFPL